MSEVNLLQILCLAIYSLGIIGSVFILLMAIAKNAPSLFPYFAASGVLFSATTGFAVLLKMMRIF
ncbi:MAG: hypothetical protein JKY27_05395 [Magnetovibrio sp.]|nr:hypothetical protein [Magnetovibrio sp.]